MVLVYLRLARYFVEFPYILVTCHVGIERGAPFVCVYDKFVSFSVLRLQIARGVIAFIPHDKIFYGKVFFDFRFEKIDFIATAKHVKRGVIFHDVVQKRDHVDNELRVVVVLNCLAKLMIFVVPPPRLVFDKIRRVGYDAINEYPPPVP